MATAIGPYAPPNRVTAAWRILSSRNGSGDRVPSQNACVLIPFSVAEVMNEVGVWWAVAGGWSIDLWLGEQTREHHDVEVVVRRCDQAAVYEVLFPRWDLSCLDPPGGGWLPWSGAALEPPAFQLQARSSTIEFDIFTETTNQAMWHFRRDDRIRRAVNEVTTLSGSGLPIVRPEVQLLYMAKSTEDKNQHDFDVARPRLNHDAASWLAEALATTLPGHHWTQEL